MSQSNESPLLFALREAGKLAVIEAAKEEPSAPIPGGVRGVRGGGSQQPGPETPGGMLVSQLGDMNSSIAGQIASVEQWLRDHPDVLHILDKAMLGHYRRFQRRATIIAIAVNAAFCVVGAVIGFVLPALAPSLGHLVGR